MRNSARTGIGTAERMTTPTLADILIGQWRAAPRLRGVVDTVLQPILDDAVSAKQRIEVMKDVNEAIGVWLDRLGRTVGVERPATSDPTADIRFGFDDIGGFFDSVPFRGDVIHDAVFPLPDAVFRRFVRARGLLVLGDGTIATFAKAVRYIDDRAKIVDNRDMSIVVITRYVDLMTLADEIGALPRTAGVMVEYRDAGTFGFDDAGVPFDSGGFR